MDVSRRSDLVDLVGWRVARLQEIVDADDHLVHGLLELQSFLLQVELAHEPRENVLVLDLGGLVLDQVRRKFWRADHFLQLGEHVSSLSNDAATTCSNSVGSRSVCKV